MLASWSTIASGDPTDETESAKRSSPNPLVASLQPAAAGARLDAAGEPMPEGMVQRLGSTRFKVRGWWRRLAFAGNDEWIWIKADQSVSVIHRESGRIVKQHQLRLGEGNVCSVAASADGRQVAIGMSDFQEDAERQFTYRVVVISARTTAHLHEFQWKAPLSELSGLSFSGDGKTLLTATERNDVRLWNLETGQLLRHLVIDNSRSRHAAVSPDRHTALLAGWDGAFLWRIDGNEEPIKLPTQRSDSVCFAPNGRMFATIMHDGARLWNAATGELLAFLAVDDKRGYDAADFGIAFTPDSRLLAVPAHRLDRIDLWNVESKQRIATLPVHRPRGLAISRNGRWLAASGDEQFTTIFDLQTHQAVNQPGDGHAHEISSIRFANADTLATSSGGDARVWNVLTGTQQHVLPHEGKHIMVSGLATSPDGTLIVTSAFDDTLGVWELNTGRRLFTLQGHGRGGGTRAVRFTSDASQIVSWGDDAVLRRWNAQDGSLAAAYTLDLPGLADPAKGEGRLTFTASAVTPDARSLFVRFEEQLYEFETSTGKRLRQVPVNRETAPLVISPDDHWIAGGQIRREADGGITGVSIVLRDRKTLEVVREWPVGDPRRADAGASDPAEADDPDNGATGRKPPISFVSQNDNGIAFSPDSTLLAWSRLGGRAGVDIVEIQGEQLLASIPVESPCWCVEISPDGKRIATGHSDSTISVWSRTHPAFVVHSGASN
jgi:WD40 repeat protein